MASTDIGMTSSARPSSRVLKPPGGGHTNIFGEPEVAVNAPRPKYNQQNSSNLNACIGSTDPNVAVEKLRGEISHAKPNNEESNQTKSNEKSNVTNGTKNNASANNNANNGGNANAGRTGRVPPGGFSSGGFW